MPAPCAIAITEENIRGVIHSEAGAKFNREAALEWLNNHGEGWFLIDPDSPFNGEFFMREVFDEMYAFRSDNTSDLINEVVRI